MTSTMNHRQYSPDLDSGIRSSTHRQHDPSLALVDEGLENRPKKHRHPVRFADVYEEIYQMTVDLMIRRHSSLLITRFVFANKARHFGVLREQLVNYNVEQ